MKSWGVSVFWPAWEWLHHPGLQYLTTSYSEHLSLRDSDRMRRLVQSDKYQELMVYCSNVDNDYKQFYLNKGGGEKQDWNNSLGGRRIATSVMGKTTGMGGDRIIIDDPHNVIEGESDIIRKRVLYWFDESLSSRLNDAKTGAIVLIMQRVHEEDLAGHVLRQHIDDPDLLEFDHLCLPGFYEGESRCNTALNYEDPRTEKDEPLFPERFDRTGLLNMVKGPYARAGQLQQRPAPRGDGFFEGEFKIIREIEELPGQVVATVRYWDKASTEDDGAYTAGVLMGLLDNNQAVVMDVMRGQWAKPRREKIIRETARSDVDKYGESVECWIEQEGGGGGKESAEDTIRNLVGFLVYKDRVTGDKETRAEPYGIQQLEGNIYVLDRHWTNDFIEEHKNFPMGRIKDMVDSASGAFNKLTGTPTPGGSW